ncbi:MAG: type II toxin-antitoxin system VapC family toxin [Candidatus Korobacteraceae bacterium]
MKHHVLDADALYRFLMDQPGADIVEDLFKRARDSKTTLLLSVINWGEVYYNIAIKRGITEAQAFMGEVRLLPLSVISADESITEAAGKLRAGYGLPYADCFAAAITGKTNVLVTADVKDFKKVPWLQILPLPQHRP